MDNKNFIQKCISVSNKKYEISQELIKSVQNYFTTSNIEMSETEAVAYIKKHPALLNYDASALKHKFKEFAKFGWSKSQITRAYNKNKNLLSFNNEDLKDKVMIYKDLGFTSSQLIANPMLLSCPSKDIKLKYMFAVILGFNTKNVKYYIQSFQKTYARGCYLKVNNESANYNLLLTRKNFEDKFQIADCDILESYAVTKDAVLLIQKTYEALLEENKNLPYIELTDDEIENCFVRVGLKNLRKSFKEFEGEL